MTVSTRLVLLPLAVALLGCGGGSDFPTAPVRGKLTYGDGQPVSVGYITFSPIAEGNTVEVGKSAEARVQEDGTYVLSTYGSEDGAVIGSHRVEYFPPEQDNFATDEEQEGEGSETEAEIDQRSSERNRAWEEYVRAHPEFQLEIPDEQRQVTVEEGDNVIDFQLEPIR